MFDKIKAAYSDDSIRWLRKKRLINKYKKCVMTATKPSCSNRMYEMVLIDDISTKYYLTRSTKIASYLIASGQNF